MRDALFLLLITAGCIATLRRPWIGVMLWTWISVMNPHAEFTYAAASWPIASAVAVSTLLGLLFTTDRHTPMLGAASWWLLAFVLWTCVTLPFSLYLMDSLPLWERSLKIFLMLFVTMALIDSRRQLEWFIWVIVISLGYFGVKGGVFTLVTGGNFRVWGPGGFIGGNNEIALALIMTIPLMRFLQLQVTRRWAKWVMAFAMALTAVTVLGTYSRGALLALIAMSGYLWLKSPNKIAYGVALVVIAFAALPFMPEHWWARMETIQTYERDDSALGRINAWWNAWNLAKDRFFGGGFMIYFPEVFARYSPEPDRVHAAHSIYFQVLGEHGFVGLFLFLAVGVSTWLCCRELIARGRADPAHRWAGDLGAMIQVSMVGYAAGGAFLSLAYFDLPYNMMAAAVLARYIVGKRVEVPVPTGLQVRGA